MTRSTARTGTTGAEQSTSEGDPTGAVAPVAAVDGLNEVRLRGRVSGPPVERVLPSGSRVVTFRLVVTREPTAMTKGSRQPSDWVECSAWSGEQRRRVLRWSVDDVVEVTGAIRRRHYRAAHGPTSIVEVEVLGGRSVRKARAGRGAPA